MDNNKVIALIELLKQLNPSIIQAIQRSKIQLVCIEGQVTSRPDQSVLFLYWVFEIKY